MSFKSSLRFQTTRDEDGRPKIFWEEAREVRPKQKYSYKKREQKHPLRSKAQRDVNIDVDPPGVKPAESHKINKTKGADQVMKPASQRRPPARQIAEHEPVLSLTEEQLTSMLAKIGQVSHKHPLRISIDKDAHKIILEEDDQNKENQTEGKETKKKAKRQKKDFSKISKENTTVSSTGTDHKSVQSTRDGDDNENDVQEGGEGQDLADDEKKSGDQPTTEATHSTPETRPSIKYLSLSEKKRIQWERERAAVVTSYSPWGRPGAGAPIKTADGDVLADYNTRKQQVVQEQILLMSPRSDAHAASRIATNPGQGATSLAAAHSDMTGGASDVPDVPVAMRSSFAIGAAAPDELRYQSKREMEKRKWLEELEKQIQERKQRQIQGVAPSSEHDSPMKPEPVHVQTKPLSAKPQPHLHIALTAPDHDVTSDMRTSQTLTDTEGQVLVSTFMRGQNAMLDPQTLKEMEEKRKRHLAHQQAVQAQVEEKQRAKREMDQLKLQEDLAEERRLQAERDNMNKQFEMEQLKQKRKMDEQSLRVQRLKEAMDEAEYVAKQDKHKKRLQHLQQHGHDVTQYHKSFEATQTPRIAFQSHGATATATAGTVTATADTASVEPAFVRGLDLATNRSGGYQTDKDYGYVENRMLTPSKYRRHTALSEPDHSRKEFGTQTDTDARAPLRPGENVTTVRRDNSAGIEFYRDKVIDDKRLEKVKKVRVVSAKTTPSKTKTVPNPTVPSVANDAKAGSAVANVPISWNYQNRLAKKAMTQSERDPYYARKRQQSLQRRQQRVQDLQSMVAANQDRIPDRSRSRSRSMSPKARTRSKSPDSGVTKFKAPRSSRLDEHDYDQWARSGQAKATGGSGTYRQEAPVNRSRAHSPPVPAVKNRLTDNHRGNADDIYHPDTLGDIRGHYSDHLPSYAPLENGEFIPFVRSSAFLDPADAQEPLPVSREPSQVEHARKAYAQNQRPGVYGAQMSHMYDIESRHILPIQTTHSKHSKNELNLVRDHPTARQEIILQQLSEMRKNLLMKQREIETCLSPTDLKYDRT